MTLTPIAKALNTPLGHFMLGFLSREILSGAGFVGRALVKGVIRNSIVVQQAGKAYFAEAKKEVGHLADEAKREADIVVAEMAESGEKDLQANQAAKAAALETAVHPAG